MTTADFTADELATLARFDATPAAPESWGGGPVDSALREGAAREMWAADIDLPIDLLSGETPSRYYQFADAALAVFAAHLGQQQAAAEADKPWVQAQAVDDAADDLFAEMDGDAWDWTEVFEWLTNRAARLRYNSPSAIAQRAALGADL